jgi:RNA polymerase sigma-70 factor (ECF subfamily)
VRLDQEQATQRFYDLIWPHRADVLRFAQFLCRESSTAEDLSQETLLKAFKALDRLSGGADVRAWLLAILRNAWLDRLRSTAAHPQVPLGELGDEIVAPDSGGLGDSRTTGDPQELLNEFSDAQVIDALQGLPQEMRWTLLLIDVEGMSLAEAAEVLQVPQGTIKSRAHRGRGLLYQALLPLARDRRMVAKGSELRQEEL